MATDVMEFPEKAWATDFSKFVVENPEFLSHSTFQEMAYSIHISTAHKIIYFEVPKNASTSIKTLLHQIEYGAADFKHNSSTDLHNRDFSPLRTPFQVRDFRSILQDDSYLKFTVFRNPLERLVSGYLDKIRVAGHYHKEIRAQTGTNGTQFPSFSEFVFWVAGQKVSEMDQHWKPQYLQSFLYAVPTIQVFSMNQLGLLNESIQRHIGSDQFSLHKIAPHQTDSKSLFAEHYSEKSIALVQRKYADDLSVWGRLNEEVEV